MEMHRGDIFIADLGVILTKVQEMQNTGKKGKKTQRILKFKNVLLLQDVV